MIDVDKSRRLYPVRERGNFCSGCYFGKTSVAVVVIEAAGAGAKNEHVGFCVVVVVTCDYCCAASLCWFGKCACLFRHVSKLAFIVAQEPLCPACCFEQVEISVSVVVKEHDAAGWRILGSNPRWFTGR